MLHGIPTTDMVVHPGMDTLSWCNIQHLFLPLTFSMEINTQPNNTPPRLTQPINMLDLDRNKDITCFGVTCKRQRCRNKPQFNNGFEAFCTVHLPRDQVTLEEALFCPVLGALYENWLTEINSTNTI